MDKNQLNEEIAALLGFKKHIGKPGSGYDGVVMWTFPEDWEDELSSSPQTSIPDFVQMLQDTRDIARKFKYGIPTHFSNHFELNTKTKWPGK